jgi:ankyrin repeat protein
MVEEEQSGVDKSAELTEQEVQTGFSETLQKKTKGPLSRLVFFIKVVILSSIIAVVWSSRNDPSVNILVSSKILPLERAFGSAISPLKSLLGIEMKLNSDELFRQLEQENLAAVTMLLDGGVDPNGANTIGDTPLAFATRNESTEAIKILLENRANPNIPNVEGFYPIHYAIENGDLDSLQVLAETGADLSARDDAELTPLMMSASRKNISMLNYLLDKNAEVDLQDERGYSALIHAVITDNVDAVVALLRAGAQVSIRAHDGKSATELAPITGEVEALFVERGLLKLDMPEQQAPPSEDEVQIEAEEAPEAPPVRISRTRVRAKGRPVGVWKNAQSLSLESVSVEVRNYGSVEAVNVDVKVRIPGGKMLKLEGPRNLSPYQEHKYELAAGESIVRDGKLKAFVTCQNCYR